MPTGRTTVAYDETLYDEQGNPIDPNAIPPPTMEQQLQAQLDAPMGTPASAAPAPAPVPPPTEAAPAYNYEAAEPLGQSAYAVEAGGNALAPQSAYSPPPLAVVNEEAYREPIPAPLPAARPIVDRPPGPLPSDPLNNPDDAARLASIRAQNASQQATEASLPPTTSYFRTTPATEQERRRRDINRLNATLSFEDPGVTWQDVTSWRPKTGLPSGDGPVALDAGFIWGPDVLPRSEPIPGRGPAVRGRAAEIPPPPGEAVRAPVQGRPAEIPPPPGEAVMVRGRPGESTLDVIDRAWNATARPVVDRPPGPPSARSQAALDQAAAQRALTPAQRAAARRTAADEEASLLAGEALRARAGTRPPIKGTPGDIPPPPGEAVPAAMPAATAARGAVLVRRAASIPARVATAPFRYVRSHPLIAAGGAAIGAAALANRQQPQDVPQPTGTVSGEQGLDDVFRDTAPVPPGGVPTRPAAETATERTLAQDINNDGVPEADVVFQGDTPIAVIDPETGDRIPLDLSTMSQEEVDAIFGDVAARRPTADTSSSTTPSTAAEPIAPPASSSTTTSQQSGGGGGDGGWVDWNDYGSGGGRSSRSRDSFAREEPEFTAEDFMEEAGGDRARAAQMAKAANRARRRKRSKQSSSSGDGFWPNFPFDRPPSPIRQHVLTALEESRNKNRRA